jgi:hypothetical protein
MKLWTPPHDAPHLFEWWRPLLLASQRARRRRLPWPLHLDEFRLAGRVVRSGRPDVWIYEHHANGGALCVDVTGTTYKFIPTPRAKGIGQFRPCDIRSAVWRAGLPEVVEPMWYEEEHTELRQVSGGVAPTVPTVATTRVVRRGHLTVIEGGG